MSKPHRVPPIRRQVRDNHNLIDRKFATQMPNEGSILLVISLTSLGLRISYLKVILERISIAVRDVDVGRPSSGPALHLGNAAHSPE
jgi:hypothetical protein